MAEGSWTDDIVLKLLNIVVYFVFLGSNIYTIAVQHGLYNGKETYITPAPWAFLIWILIHLLLLGTIAYQFTAAGKRVIVDGISWRFALLGVLNAVYANIWASHHYIVAFIFALFVSSTVTYICYVIKKQYILSNTSDEIFVHLPFSLWLGWSIVLVVLTAFEAFGVSATTEVAGVWTKVFVFLALFFLGCTAAAYALTFIEGELPASIAIIWSLFAIFAQQGDPFVHWTSFVFAILSALCLVKGIWGLYRKFTRSAVVLISDEERAPLIPGN